MKFSDVNCEPKKRKIIIISSEEDYKNLPGKNIGKEVVDYLESPFLYLIKTIDRAKKILTGEKEIPYPIFNIEDAKKLFEFPPEHPIPNTVYAMCDIIPNTYIPLYDFHRYLQEVKHKSLTDLCANLGAKEIYLEYSEIDNKSVNVMDIKEDNIPTELGDIDLKLKIDSNKNTTGKNKLVFTFDKRNKEIKEYQSPWENTEPTWKDMRDKRINNYATSSLVEYNYIKDYGINAKLIAKLNKKGISTGGSFKEFHEIKLIYKVIFWE